MSSRSPPPALLPPPVQHYANPHNFVSPAAAEDLSSMKQRPLLFLFLLGSLLLVSLSFNAFLCAELWWNDGTEQLSEGCSTFLYSNLHRPKRQIEENDGILMMEYAVNNQPSKSAEIAAEGKEEEDDMPLFVPLYTQMSQKFLNKICHEKFGRQLQNVETGEESPSDTEHNRTKQKKPLRTKGHRRKSYREKVCSPIHSLGAPRFMARRVHQRGSAMRRGGRWFLTEYDTGYTLFQFDLPTRGKNETVNAKVAKKRRHLAELDTEMADEGGVELAFPSQILTLPEPFRGSDHSVGGAKGDETFFYQLASGGRIQALHLRTGKRLSKLVYAAKHPLYGSAPTAADEGQVEFGGSPPMASSVDLEVDQSALWVLFRRPNLSSSSGRPLPHLTVLKLTPDSLKELGQWELKQIMADQMSNAFVACGQLYGVTEAQMRQSTNSDPTNSFSPSLHIVPLFDFRTGHNLSETALPITAPGWTASGRNSISNVQYDAVSDSLIAFDRGNVYTLQIQRKGINRLHQRQTEK